MCYLEKYHQTSIFIHFGLLVLNNTKRPSIKLIKSSTWIHFSQKYFIYLIFWDVIWTEQSLEVWICFFIFCCFGLVFFRNCSLLCQGASLQHLWGKSFGLCCGFIGAWCRNSLTFSKWSLFKITVTAATLKYRKKTLHFSLTDNQRGRHPAEQPSCGHLSDDRARETQRQVWDHRWCPWKRPADRCGNGPRQGAVTLVLICLYNTSPS